MAVLFVLVAFFICNIVAYGGKNSAQACSIAPECRRTCAAPNPPNCPYQPADTNIDGCNCQVGYILSQEYGGTCIKIENCPSNLGCNNDTNARPKSCPTPCPSTCSSPNATPCKKACEPIGCECALGYMFSNDAKCILPEECPGGNPCGPNSRFVGCRNNCPTLYCPPDESRASPICIPSPYCLPGCMCELNHKKLSWANETCVVSSSCPPVNCTRPNEVWSSCPSACLAENCKDIHKKPSTCNTLVLNCQPNCICKKNYFRNMTDICVSVQECRSAVTTAPSNVNYSSLLLIPFLNTDYLDFLG